MYFFLPSDSYVIACTGEVHFLRFQMKTEK